MTDKEKLIDLLKGAERKVKDKNPNMPLNEWLDIYVDNLIANGVIVPPCKVGDKLYKLSGGEVVRGWEITSITIYKSGFYITDNCYFHYADNEIGKSVFLTKEEAERELEKRGEQNACNN